MNSLPKLLREGNVAAIAALLFLAVGITYFPALNNGFVNLDDPAYIYSNLRVRNGLTWDGIRWGFTTLDRGFWHPLTWLSIMLDCQVFGPRAWGHHLTSILLHGANTVLLFLVLRRMTGATWRSAFVAALFGLHPQHVESVAWASERKDVLSTFFLMLTLWAYARYALGSGARSHEPGSNRSRNRRHYMLALVFFTLGLMSKAMVVTLPLLLLLIDWWPLRRWTFSPAQPLALPPGTASLKALLWEKAPFFGIALVFGLLTLVAQGESGALQTVTRFPVLFRVQNAILAYADYLVQMVWPVHLAAFYPYPKMFSAALVAAVGFLGLMVTAVAFWAARKHHFFTFGWIWYGLTLLPVIGLIQVGSQSHADRYTYVPTIGLFVILAWGAGARAREIQNPKSEGRKSEEASLPTEAPAHADFHSTLLTFSAAILLLICAGLTWRQIGYWKDSETLFRHALAVTSNNEVAHNNLGTTLMRKGRLDEAIRHFEAAVRISPAYAVAQGNLGAVLFSKGRLDESIVHSEAAIRLRPGFAGAHRNLGAALGRKGRLDEAMPHFEAAVQLAPEDPEAHYNYGVALAGKGRMDEAIVQFQETVKLAPDNPDARQNLQAALAAKAAASRKPQAPPSVPPKR